MTFDVNDILKQLENGTDVNDIAAAAANAINDAMKLQEKKKKEAERMAEAKEKIAAFEAKKAKVADLGYLIEELIKFLNEYYPKLLTEEVPEEPIKRVAGELVDVFDKAYDETMKLFDSDDNIQKFLRENKLI